MVDKKDPALAYTSVLGGALRDLAERFNVKKVEVPETRGKKPKWAWEKATNAVWGRIYRGEIIPEPTTQAEIVALLAEWFIDSCGDAPGETSLKEHAQNILVEVRKGR
jgi:hypothetical protein